MKRIYEEAKAAMVDQYKWEVMKAEERQMQTFQQTKITGYRQLSDAALMNEIKALSEDDAAMMNEIKAAGVQLGELVAKLRLIPGLDQRWVSIGATDLQTGLMALTRSVAQPTTF